MKAVGELAVFLLNVYSGLIFIWVLANWMPQLRDQPWFKYVDDAVRPVLHIFRGLKLETGMIDFTPAVAMTFIMLFTEAIKASMDRF
jgi:uncharacterized protein YggT (Ycf19 family)